MKDLIFEALVAEAQFRVAEHTIKGAKLDEAITEVAREMELEESEVQELTQRVKKKPSKPVREEEEVDMDDLMSDMDSDESESGHKSAAPDSNAIYFSSPDELETAMGVLMYKGIPWISKNEDSVVFQDSSFVAKAHDALKRRWDFVNNDERTVAILEFDNLDDYQKVLDFLATKNMTVLKGSNDELMSDLDQELSEAEAAHKKAKKDAKESGQPVPEEPTQAMSYKALHKDKLTDVKSLDAAYDSTARCLRVVKRWK